MNRSIITLAIASSIACSAEAPEATAGPETSAGGMAAQAHRARSTRSAPMLQTPTAFGDMAPQRADVPASSASQSSAHQNRPARPRGPQIEDPEIMRHDPASVACGQVPEHFIECPIFDKAAIEAVPGLADLEEACGRWMQLRPDDYRAEVYESAEYEGEMEEKGMKGIVCGGFVAEVADIETGERIEEGGFPTAEMVFAETARLMMDSDEPVEIIFDEEFGYPAYVAGRLPSPDGPSAFKMSYEVFTIAPAPKPRR